MSKLLVIYETVEGQTAKIATVLAEEARLAGSECEVVRAADTPTLDFTSYDGVIVAAPLHQEEYPRAVKNFVRRYRNALARLPSAFVSVGLSMIGTAEDREEAAICASDFFADTGWRPSETKHVAGALRFSQYNWLKRVAMRSMMRERGLSVEGATDAEFTDWSDVRIFARHFVESVAAVETPPGSRRSPGSS